MPQYLAQSGGIRYHRVNMHSDDYEHLVKPLLKSLGIPLELIAQLRLPYFAVARELVVAETGVDGFQHLLIPSAAEAWFRLRDAARADGIVLEIVSAFRDLESQSEIVRDKIRRGMPFETLFTLSAPPGYSEHHTGRALDLNTPGCEPREAPFADTAAYRWLGDNAQHFGFTLSYPPGNSSGFIHEPWHWYFKD